jgi:hypothetical protein
MRIGFVQIEKDGTVHAKTDFLGAEITDTGELQDHIRDLGYSEREEVALDLMDYRGVGDEGRSFDALEVLMGFDRDRNTLCHAVENLAAAAYTLGRIRGKAETCGCLHATIDQMLT